VQIAMRAGEPLPRSLMIVVLTGGLLALIVAAAVLLAVS
jgi:putative membrane protein